MGNQESSTKVISDFIQTFVGKNINDITDEKKRVNINKNSCIYKQIKTQINLILKLREKILNFRKVFPIYT